MAWTLGKNPYLVAWRRQQSHRREVDGPRWSALILPLALGLAGVLSARALGDLAGPGYGKAVAAIALRAGAVMAGAMILGGYSVLVRGPDRVVLDPHPSLPGPLVRTLAWRAAVERLDWLVGAFALLAPFTISHPGGGLLIAGVTAGAWICGLLVSFPVHLGAAWAAESPGLAAVMEMVRGDNPRLQAALIYAPGAAFGLALLPISLAAEGARAALEGQPSAALALLAPPLAGALAFAAAPALAARHHHRTTQVLAEIDAAWAAVESADEARRVYLEWALRFLPPALASATLKELRHGWRGLRTWISGAWGLALVGVGAAWSKDPSAQLVTLGAASAAVVLISLVGPRLAATDPAWLDQWLGSPWRRPARGLAVFGWLAPIVLLPALALATRQGAAAGALLGLKVALMAGLMSIVSAGFSVQRAQGALPVAALGTLAWAGLMGISA